MAKSSGPPPIVYILILLLLGGGGYWFFTQQQNSQPTNPSATSPGTSTDAGTATNPAPNLPTVPIPATPPAPAPGQTAFALPTSVPPGTSLEIDGSTSMVTINQNLKQGFEQQFANTTITPKANGSNNGLQALIAGTVDLAAMSRPLTPQEQNQGLVGVSIALDQIALVVGKENPFAGGLTSSQVMDIFTGSITDWSAVGGPPGEIRVINRPPVSGTHQAFRELVLNGQNFGTTPNITTLPRDETTGLLRQLQTNGIGYATFAQVINQQTVRMVSIDGAVPGAANYPYQRQLYYVYKSPANPAVQAFLGYVQSPSGQQAMFGN